MSLNLYDFVITKYHPCHDDTHQIGQIIDRRQNSAYEYDLRLLTCRDNSDARYNAMKVWGTNYRFARLATDIFEVDRILQKNIVVPGREDYLRQFIKQLLEKEIGPIPVSSTLPLDSLNEFKDDVEVKSEKLSVDDLLQTTKPLVYETDTFQTTIYSNPYTWIRVA